MVSLLIAATTASCRDLGAFSFTRISSGVQSRLSMKASIDRMSLVVASVFGKAKSTSRSMSCDSSVVSRLIVYDDIVVQFDVFPVGPTFHI